MKNIKKNLITTSLFLSGTLAIASDFVIVVDKKNNDYIGGTNTEVSYSNWVEVSNVCSNDKEIEDVYYDQSFTQETTCTKTEERTKTVKYTLSDGSTKIEETTETKNTDNKTTQSLTGTHIENSCYDALAFDSNLSDGVYMLSLNDGSQKELYCDMTNGGWTLVSHIYDRDNRDDILNNSNGAGWGVLSNTPTSDTSFNLANNLTPNHTTAEYEWIYPMYGDQYRHYADSDLIDNRYKWSNPNGTATHNLTHHLVNDLKIQSNNGYIYGVFGVHSATYNHTEHFGSLANTHGCGSGLVNDKATHYWGFGSIIAHGNDSTYELHNIDNGLNRATGDTSPNGCGTRNSILNIWVK